jgi:hypothetical protein
MHDNGSIFDACSLICLSTRLWLKVDKTQIGILNFKKTIGVCTK